MPSDANIRLLGELKKRRAEITEMLKEIPDNQPSRVVLAKIDERIAQLNAEIGRDVAEAWKTRFPPAS